MCKCPYRCIISEFMIYVTFKTWSQCLNVFLHIHDVKVPVILIFTLVCNKKERTVVRYWTNILWQLWHRHKLPVSTSVSTTGTGTMVEPSQVLQLTFLKESFRSDHDGRRPVSKSRTCEACTTVDGLFTNWGSTNSFDTRFDTTKSYKY